MNRLKTKKPVSQFLIWLPLLCSSSLYGQATGGKQLLPDAPQVSLVALAQQDAAPMQQGSSEVSAAKSVDAVSSQHPRLTQSDAEKLAIKNNPRVSVARLLALAQHQVVRETRSAELPTGIASITAEDAENGSRISAGSLTASRLFEHAGAGGGFTQLITDFGRTSNLVASSKLQEKAQNANALASIEDIVLAADQAFFNALQAQRCSKWRYKT
jgi:outer membrane protein